MIIIHVIVNYDIFNLVNTPFNIVFILVFDAINIQSKDNLKGELVYNNNLISTETLAVLTKKVVKYTIVIV